MCCGFGITKIETTNSDPRLKLAILGKFDELLHHGVIISVCGDDVKRFRVNERKGVEQMGVAVSV